MYDKYERTMQPEIVYKDLSERSKKIRELLRQRDPGAKEYIEESLQLAQNSNENDKIGEMLVSMSNYYSLIKRDIDQCLEYIHQAKPYFDIGDSRRAGYYYGALGINYHFFYKLPEAQDAYLTSIQYMEEIDDLTEEESQRLATVYYNLYILFSFTDLSLLDRKYLDRAIELYKLHNHKAGLIFCYGAIINDLDKLGNIAEALEYARIRLRLAEELDDNLQVAFSSSTIGVLYAKMNDRQTAMEFINRAKKIFEKANITQFLSSFYDEYAQAHLALGDYDEAISLFLKAIDLYNLLDSTLNLSKLYRLLSEAYEKSGRYQDSLEYQKKYSQILLDNFKVDKVLYMSAVQNEFERQQQERETDMLKLKNEEVRQYANQLEQSNEELKQFAHAASHDLREPVRMIVSYTELLEMNLKGKLTAEQHELFGYLKEGGKRINEMIAGILAFSKVNNHHELAKVNLNDILQSVKANLKIPITAQHAVIECGQLPTVLSNHVLMIQLFQNLISNAIKYNSSSQPSVKIDYYHDAGLHTFCFSDNGIGIEDMYREKVFDIFTRLQNRQHHSGSGIGLAICKKIVDRLGGDIINRPNKQGGTDFVFTIPGLK
jgi:signal transduction histidine kinase